MVEYFRTPLGIPHSALISVLLGMTAVSFPLGAYVVFDADIGKSVTFQMPASHIAAFGAESYAVLPQFIQLGDLFIALWSIYAIFFAVAVVGPDRDVFAALRDNITGKGGASNYMVHALSWLSVLVLASAVIDILQGQLGLSMAPPEAENDLVQFYLISAAPLSEELLYRVMLVGLPLFAIYAHRMSPGFLLKSLWHPGRHLHVYDGARRAAVVVLATGVLFGVSHVLFGDSWGPGKLAQATVAGIILGYVYYKYGFVCALLVHWAMNYFVYSYGHFVAHLGQWGIGEAFEQPFFDTIQIILLVAGAVTLCAIAARHLHSPVYR